MKPGPTTLTGLHERRRRGIRFDVRGSLGTADPAADILAHLRDERGGYVRWNTSRHGLGQHAVASAVGMRKSNAWHCPRHDLQHRRGVGQNRTDVSEPVRQIHLSGESRGETSIGSPISSNLNWDELVADLSIETAPGQDRTHPVRDP